MSNLYNVKLKIGKRTYTTKMYASTYNDILTFVNKNLQSKVVEIQEVVYTAPTSQIYNVDDPTTYQSTLYYMIANLDAKKSNQIVLQTVKKTRNVNEVYQDLKLFLRLDKLSKITSMLSANQSSK